MKEAARTDGRGRLVSGGDAASGDTASTADQAAVGRLSWWGLACIGFVFAAVALEALAGLSGGLRLPGWVHVAAPPAWPPPLRGVWWLAVAGGAVGYRLAERRCGLRRHWLTVALSAAPFVVFAVGAAAGSGWASWH